MSKIKEQSLSIFYGVTAAGIGMFLSNPAYADPTLATSIKGTGSSLLNIPQIISVIAYALGGAVMISAAAKIKAHSDHPSQTTMSAGMWRFLIAAILIGMGGFSKELISSMGWQTSAQQGIQALGTTANNADVSLDVLLTKFMANIQKPLINLTSLVSYILGASLVLKGLLKGVRYADDGPKGQSGMGVLAHILVGAALMALPGFLGQMANTLSFSGNAQFHQLAFNNAGMDAAAKLKANNAAKAVFAFVQLLGLIGLVRGINMLRTVADGGAQNASMPAAMTHIIAGALAWNIVPFIDIIQNTLNLTGADRWYS